MNEALDTYTTYKNMGFSEATSESAYREWVLPQDDGSLIKIECSYIYYCNEELPLIWRWDLIWGYTLIDSSIVEAAAEAEAAINDDL